MAAVMTVFNRRETTLKCLESLRDQVATGTELTTIVVDDASTDGTADAIAEQYPEVRLVRGNGDLFWNGGMRAAYGQALAEGYDFYWWLNDDVELDNDCLSRLLDTAAWLESRSATQGIVVGSTRDPDDGHITYGGVVRRTPLRRFDFVLVDPSDEPVMADTMNGNCTLIPKSVAHELGNITDAYRQKMGDFDYGLMARQQGFGVWVAPGTHGVCSTHPERRTDVAPLRDELRRLWSIKELPFGPWAAFTRRWGGPLWPLYFLSPYLRRGGRLVAERLRIGRS